MIGYDLIEYAKDNKSTNEKMNNIIENISEEEWKKEFNGYYKSIYELCSHIYSADFNWFKRFIQNCDFEIINKDFFGKDFFPERIFTKTIFKNINEYVHMRKELDEIIIEFISKLSENDLNKILIVNGSNGNIFELIMGELIFYIFKHEIHHRGMISLYLDMLGIENDYC
ncbi:MAG: DinB family protein [Treponema sp.]|nr:DinB family protein [Treponema sp.]